MVFLDILEDRLGAGEGERECSILRRFRGPSSFDPGFRSNLFVNVLGTDQK